MKTILSIYNEAQYLMNEFTFGFELEGFIDTSEEGIEKLSDFTDEYFKKYESELYSIKDMSFGDDGTINPKDTECPECEGSGLIKCSYCNGVGETESHEEECPECRGDGWVNTVLDEEGKYKIENCDNCNATGSITIEPERCYECNGEGNIQCSTCEGSGYEDSEDRTFEFRSPVFKCNMINLKIVIEYLDTVMKEYASTNDTCGFHVHIGFPDKFLVNEHRMWALINLASNEDMFEKIKDFKGIKLHETEYASLSMLDNINKMLNNITLTKEDILNQLTSKDYYTSYKYLAFRQHPQGTLEWRGPRGFLDLKNRQIIFDFFVKLLYPLVRFFNDAIEKDKIIIHDEIVTKEEFFNILKDKKKLYIPEKPQRSDGRFVNNSDNYEVIGKFFQTYPKYGRIKFKRVYISYYDGRFTIQGGYGGGFNIDNQTVNGVENFKIKFLDMKIKNSILKDIYCVNSSLTDSTISGDSVIIGRESGNYIIENCKVESGSFDKVNIIGGLFLKGSISDSNIYIKLWDYDWGTIINDEVQIKENVKFNFDSKKTIDIPPNQKPSKILNNFIKNIIVKDLQDTIDTLKNKDNIINYLPDIDYFGNEGTLNYRKRCRELLKQKGLLPYA